MFFRPICSDDTVLFDTDIGTDCDDVGALAVLLTGCRGLGVKIYAVNDTSNPYGSGAIDAVATHYGFSDLPIGQWEKPGFFDEDMPGAVVYNRALTQRFSPRYAAGKPLSRPAAEVYHEALTASEDGHLVIITVGFFNALAEALSAEPALFARKVRAVVSMAGHFGIPGKPNWNVMHNVSAARAVVGKLSCPQYFIGEELGPLLLTGFDRPDENNPVSFADV